MALMPTGVPRSVLDPSGDDYDDMIRQWRQSLGPDDDVYDQMMRQWRGQISSYLDGDDLDAPHSGAASGLPSMTGPPVSLDTSFPAADATDGSIGLSDSAAESDPSDDVSADGGGGEDFDIPGDIGPSSAPAQVPLPSLRGGAE